MSKVTVLGSGAWGTTQAQGLCDSGQDVLIWVKLVVFNLNLSLVSF